jgi:hypothetical protein
MKTLLTAAAVAAAASLATAGGFTTTYNDSLTNFGSSLDAFVGDGIPNSNMVVSRAGDVQVGLKAIERFVGDLATNAAGDRYIAQPGFSPTSGSNPTPSTNATWNYVYAIDLGSSLTLGDVQIDFYVDFDPSSATDFTHIDVSTFIDANAPSLNGSNKLGDSQNLAFSFWNLIYGQSFDPNAPGLYNFSLTLRDAQGSLITQNDMTVQVVPLPPAAWAGLATLGAAFGVRKLRRR